MLAMTVVLSITLKSSVLKGKIATSASLGIFLYFWNIQDYTSEFPAQLDNLYLSSLSSPWFRCMLVKTQGRTIILLRYMIFFLVCYGSSQQLTWNLTNQDFFFFPTKNHLLSSTEFFTLVFLNFLRSIKQKKTNRFEKYYFKVSEAAGNFIEI